MTTPPDQPPASPQDKSELDESWDTIINDIAATEYGKEALDRYCQAAVRRARIEEAHTILKALYPILGMDHMPSSDLVDYINSIKNHIAELETQGRSDRPPEEKA